MLSFESVGIREDEVLMLVGRHATFL
jgi:hypothetical protein